MAATGRAGASSTTSTRGRSGGPREVLDLRALNRATLDRQLLLARRRMPVATALEHLVGLQAQATDPPYLGLLARLDGYHPDDLVRLVTQRQAVRATLMRGTIHLVTAGDALWLRPLVQPVLDRVLTSSPARKQVAALDRAELTALATEVLGAGPVSNPDLARALTARWPQLDPDALAACARSLVPTVQVPPRGLWRTSGPVRHTTLPRWLGSPLSTDASLEVLVRRYLTAFGPATVADVQKWCGLQGLRPVVEAMATDRPTSRSAAGAGLRRFHDTSGRELWDVPRARLPDAATPAPVRYLPDFDNVLISYDARERVIARDLVQEVFTVNGLIRPTVLVDGFVRAMWSVDRDRAGARLVVRPFQPLPASAVPELMAEGRRVLEVVAPGDVRREVVVRS